MEKTSMAATAKPRAGGKGGGEGVREVLAAAAAASPPPSSPAAASALRTWLKNPACTPTARTAKMQPAASAGCRFQRRPGASTE